MTLGDAQLLPDFADVVRMYQIVERVTVPVGLGLEHSGAGKLTCLPAQQDLALQPLCEAAGLARAANKLKYVTNPASCDGKFGENRLLSFEITKQTRNNKRFRTTQLFQKAERKDFGSRRSAVHSHERYNSIIVVGLK